VAFQLGNFYAQSYPRFVLASGDTVKIGVNSASITVRVRYGTPVRSSA
jgi:hypothetical protein